MNYNRISDICEKVNFITNYTHFTTPDNILSKYTLDFIKTHTNIKILSTKHIKCLNLHGEANFHNLNIINPAK